MFLSSCRSYYKTAMPRLRIPPSVVLVQYIDAQSRTQIREEQYTGMTPQRGSRAWFVFVSRATLIDVAINKISSSST